ncbi:melanoma-associated antigen 10-like [Thomomys bottae]
MLPYSQKTQQGKCDGSPQAQSEALQIMAELVSVSKVEEAIGTASVSSTPLIPATSEKLNEARKVHGSLSASSHCFDLITTLQSKLNQGSKSQASQDLLSQGKVLDPVSLLQLAASLVSFLLLKYRKKEPTTKAEMLNHVIRSHHEYFSVILNNASERMQLVFGIELKEVDPTHHSYILVTSLGLTYDGIMSDVHGMPKTGLLIMVLGVISIEGNCVPEEVVWESLSVMGVSPGSPHYFYGNPRKLIAEDFVREQYLVYRQVPKSFPVHYEFLWGPRAHAETSKVKVLKHWAKFSGCDPKSLSVLYEKALTDEDEGTQA